MSGEGVIGDKLLHVGQPVSLPEALIYSGEPPHLTVVFKLCKDHKDRQAPDGR